MINTKNANELNYLFQPLLLLFNFLLSISKHFLFFTLFLEYLIQSLQLRLHYKNQESVCILLIEFLTQYFLLLKYWVISNGVTNYSLIVVSKHSYLIIDKYLCIFLWRFIHLNQLLLFNKDFFVFFIQFLKVNP